MNQQWVKVTRPDGAVQYATKVNESYYLNGSGFGIRKFCEGTIVEAIKGCPPSNYRYTRVGFEKGRTYSAIVDVNQRWNGWACPWIHEKDVPRLVRYMRKYNDMERWCMLKNGVVVVYGDCGDKPDVYKPEVHPFDGERYYYFGGMYTWEEFNKSKK